MQIFHYLCTVVWWIVQRTVFLLVSKTKMRQYYKVFFDFLKHKYALFEGYKNI